MSGFVQLRSNFDCPALSTFINSGQSGTDMSDRPSLAETFETIGSLVTEEISNGTDSDST
jgi:hypothetical protein